MIPEHATGSVISESHCPRGRVGVDGVTIRRQTQKKIRVEELEDQRQSSERWKICSQGTRVAVLDQKRLLCRKGGSGVNYEGDDRLSRYRLRWRIILCEYAD
jgi:hypothetical protein